MNLTHLKNSILNKKIYRPLFVFFLIAVISLLHYNTPTMNWQYHLVYMQAYFIPILLAAFWYGIRGGLGSALIISAIYLPHIMLQWGGLVENNLMRFMQIVLFNTVGYLTGLKAQGEQEEKKRYRQAADELKKTLARVRTQSEQISEMEQQIRVADRLAIVGELTASLAHEVRNPLGSIRGAVEIIRSSVPEDVQQSEFFDILIEETERLNRVVENYLRFSRKSGDRLSVFDIRKTLHQLVMMMQAPARKKQVRLQEKYPDTTFHVKGDPNQLWQVVMNIILNALQAVDPNGVISLILNDISGTGTQEKRLRLTISDNGSGMSAEQLPNIFKALYTTKRNGTGLGLAIVKRIADENQWTLNVHSTQGVGTDFVMEIPALPI